MKVYGTKEGKLYIKPIDLFSQPKVQALINRVANSEIVKKIHNRFQLKD